VSELPSLFADVDENGYGPFSFRPHPAWQEGFTAREGVPIYVNGWRVTAKDATGAEFGFAVMNGDPGRAESMARALEEVLAREANA
jgi:hypothetical protein